MYIFFDLDDTLVDSDSAHVKAIREICSEFSLLSGENEDIIVKEWLEIKEKYISLYFQKKIGLEEQRISRITEFWKNRGKSIDKELAMKIYWKYHHIFLHSCKTFSETVPALRQLKGIRLGIISNGTSPDQLFKLQYNHLAHFFDVIVISDRVGFSKPSKEIFELAAVEARVPISDCLFVGNSYDLDYLGSLNAGMQSILLNRSSLERNVADEDVKVISKLAELPAKLKWTLF